MNNLHRELAPISDAAWAQIEQEATRTLKVHLAGRRVVDVDGPAGADLAAAFEAVTGEEWLRPGRRGDGASFTVDSFSRYMVHDPVHHLFDVTGERSGRSSPT